MRTNGPEEQFRQPVILLVGPVVDEVGDQEGRNHREHRGADAPQSVGHLRFTKKYVFFISLDFLENKSTITPILSAPEKAFCSWGER